MAEVPLGQDVLQAGFEYVINIFNTADVITVIAPAEVCLRTWDRSDANQKFLCIENDKNWLGLRSMGTGKYLGRDRYKNMGCAASSQSESESFVFRQSVHGGSAMFVQSEGRSDGRFYRTYQAISSTTGGLYLGTDTNANAAVVGFTKVHGR